MMVNSVSGVHFTAQDMLSRPGAYAKEPEEKTQVAAERKSKKTSTATKVVLTTVIGAAALLGGAAALKHFKPETFKILDADKLTKAGILEKAAHYTAKLGNFVIEKGSKFTEAVSNFFKRNK